MNSNSNKIFIRRATISDMKSISSLYDYKISETELKWVLSDPWKEDLYRSFVAVKDDGIVGHIGYILYSYRFNDSKFRGVHPISWIVSKDIKGPVGILLMKKLIEIGEGDFTYTIGGSKTTQEIAPLFRFRFAFCIDNYFKVVNWANYFKMQTGGLIKQGLKTLLTFVRSMKVHRMKQDISDMTLEKYKGGKIQKQPDDPIFFNDLDEKEVKWLLKCPLLKTEAFLIKKNAQILGFAILYINERPNNVKSGRIVHLSYICNNETIWCSVISKIEQFLKEKGCATISTLASHPSFKKGLELSGYLSTRHGRPVFIRDTNNVYKNISTDCLHLTFCEGDLGYRGV